MLNIPTSRLPLQRVALALVVLAGSLVWSVAVNAPRANAGPPPVITTYVPLPTDDYQTALYTVNSGAGTSMNERIGISIAGDGMILYYDHWEDGFEADIANPVQSTTQLWGDGLPSNGDASTVCSSCVGDLLNAGDVILLSANALATPRNTSTIAWDGGDKVAGTRGFTLTRAGWGQAGQVHAGAVSGYDTSLWGRRFVSPVGEDTIGGSGSDDPFNYTGISIMAQAPGTVVNVDVDNDGSFDISQTIAEGETLMVNGGLMEGATVIASQPVSAFVLTGDRTASYEDRWFELFPTASWDTSYFAAAVVGTSADQQDTELWVHNDNIGAIDVDIRSASGVLTTLTINSGETVRYRPPLSTAVQLDSSDGPFYSFGTIGTASPGDSQDHDWGYTLVPTSILTPSMVIGWAPGDGSASPSNNYSAVYVAAVEATVIDVDYDGDGTADYSFSATPFTSYPLVDTSDNDMTGARITSVSGKKLTAAYGQNPTVATDGNPALDLGITVVPSTALVVTKDVTLVADVNSDGFINPGDTVRWDITVSDAGALALSNVSISDAVPLHTTYVANSTSADLGLGPVSIPDSTVPPAVSAFPFDEGGLGVGTIQPGATISLAFLTLIDNPLPASIERIPNTVYVTSSQVSGSASADAPVFVPELAIVKTSDAAGVLSPGDPIAYTVVVENTGDLLQTGIDITDLLPAGVSWVSTAVESMETIATSAITDDFESNSYSGGTGWGSSTWQELNDNGNSGTGNVNLQTSGTNTYLYLQSAGMGAFRDLGDLSTYEYVELAFDFRRRSLESDFEWLDVEVSPDGGTTWNPVARFSGPANDPAFLSRSFNVTPFVNRTAGETSVVRFRTSTSMSTADVIEVDNVAITLVDRALMTTVGVEPVGPTFSVLSTPLTLAPLDSATITIVAAVDNPMAPFSASITNRASVTSDQNPSPAVSEITDTVVLIDLSLAKTETNSPLYVGDQAVFEITVSNDGPSEATGVEVVDLLPSGLTYVSDTATQGAYDDTTGLWIVGDIATGGSATLTLTATVTTAAAVANTAEVTASGEADADSTPDNDISTEDDQDSVTVDVIEAADLSITKSETNSPSFVGDTAIFEITVTNSGPSATTGVVVDDLLPPGLIYVSDSPTSGSYVPGTGQWTVGPLAIGQSETLTVTATVTTDAIVTNSAEVVASGQIDPDSTPDNDVASEDDQASAFADVNPLVDVSLTKMVDDTAPLVGSSVVYTVAISNGGPSTATGVEAVDLLPPGLAYTSHGVSQGTYTSGTGLWEAGTLMSGESATLTIAATVTASGTVANSAEVVSVDQTDSDSVPDNDVPTEDDQDSADINAIAVADIEVAKSIDDATPDFGSSIEFIVSVRNIGPSDATGVVVKDLLPGGLTFSSAVVTAGVYTDGDGLWTVGALASGQSETLTISAVVTGVAPGTNEAELVASDQFDPDSTPGNDIASEDDQDSTSWTPVAIDLSLTKSVDVSAPNIDDLVAFTIRVTNSGPSSASGVEATDLLPAGLAFVSAAPSQGSYIDGTGVWSIGSLADGQSETLTITAVVTITDPVTNGAEVTSANQVDVDSTPNNDVLAEDDQDSAIVDAVPIADISLTKVVDRATPNVGSSVTFTLTVANDGPSPATGIEVTDLLPPGLTFTSSAPSQGSYVSASGLWTVGSLAVGQSETLEIVAVVTTSGFIVNGAEVTAANEGDVDSTPDNNVGSEDDQDQVSVTGQQVDLSLTKTVDNALPLLGETITFTLSVSNTGPSTATSVVVRDLLPLGLLYDASTPSQGAYDDVTGIWTVGTLASGESQTLTIDAVLTTTIAVSNVAEITAVDQPDSDSTPDNNAPAEDDQDSVVVTHTPRSDLSVTKTETNSPAFVGDNAVFDVTVSNDGPSTATGVAVTDQLPAGLTYVSDSATQGSYDDTTGIWTVGILTDGQSETLTLTAEVTTDGPVRNIAEVSAQDGIDPDSTPGNGVPTEDDQDSAIVSVSPVADLSLSKAFSSASAGVGSNVTFTLTVTNDGPSDASGVEVTDVLPAGLTYVSGVASLGSFDDSTGVWTVGALSDGQTETFVVTVTVTAARTITNTSEITAVAEFDSDSTPNNGVPSEDDQASASLVGILIDLELDVAVDDPNANRGDNVIFTVTLVNRGPSGASSVSVSDSLPAGLVFVSSGASQGSYDDATGVWSVGNLLNGQSETLVVVATVNTDAVSSYSAQVAAADQPDADSTPANDVPAEDDQDAAVVTPTPVADLELSKSVDSATPFRGSTVTFTISVVNNGPSSTSGVSVTDVLPPGLSYVSYAASQGTFDVVTGVWTVGSLTSGQSESMTIDATVDTDTPVTNSAEVSSATENDPDSTPGNNAPSEDDQDSVIVTPVPLVDLSLSKTVDTAAPQIGDTATFSVTVSNAGPSDATGVEVTDLLPTGVTYASDAPTQGTYDDATGVWIVGDLAIGQSETLDITVTVVTDQAVTNLAEVTAADQVDADSTPGNGALGEDDQDTALLSPTPLIDLEIAKTVDIATPNVGDNVDFTIAVTNQGPSDATGVEIVDLLPVGLVYVADTVSLGTYDSLTGEWLVGDVGSGQTETLTITVTVAVAGAVANIAEVLAADQPDGDSTPDNDVPAEDDQDVSVVTGQLIDLQVTDVVDISEVSPSGLVTFTITVDNLGPSAATGVSIAHVVTGTAPVTYISDTSGGSYDPATGTWNVGSLSAGGAASFDVTFSVDDVGSVVSTAQVAAADQPDIDSTPGNDASSEDDQDSDSVISTLVDIELIGSVSDAVIGLGETTTFTFTVSNVGPSDASAVAVTERLPAGLVYVSDLPSQGTFEPSTGEWLVGDLAVGASATLQVTVNGAVPGNLTTIAEVTQTYQTDVDSTPDNDVPAEDDQVVLSVEIVAIDLSLTKTVDFPAPVLGDTVTFTLTVSNDGPSAATGVVATDSLPSGLTYVSSAASQGSYDSVSGLWSIGSLSIGQSVSLSIDAAVDTVDAVVNVTQIAAADQLDLDSVPGNGVASEDDQDSVLVDAVSAQLSGVVWIDENENGHFDQGETPAQGVVLSLVTIDGTTIRSIVTGVDGAFGFTGLAPAEYTIVIDSLPDGLEIGTFDPDGDVDGRHTLVLVDGANIVDVDFGLLQVAPPTTAPPTTTPPPDSGTALPTTGANVDSLLLIAIMLLFSGLLALYMASRSREDREHRS